jgi:MSHA biogenesis protein MshJ
MAAAEVSVMGIGQTYYNLNSRFNAMSLRERAMVAAAVLAVIILAWDQFLMRPLDARKTELSQEITSIERNLKTLNDTIEGRVQGNPLSVAMEKKVSLTASLTAVDAQLQAESAGLIPPERMLQALRDVLDTQHGLRLISMRNLPVSSLASAADANGAQRPPSGPFVHSLELVVDGGYLDVLRYLEKVESLPWKFYWQVLELKSTDYPLNRVRIRLNTLSMEKEWLGV